MRLGLSMTLPGVAGRGGSGRRAILFVGWGQSNADGAALLASYEAQDTPLPNMFQMSRGFSTNYAAGERWGFIAATQPLQRFQSANTNLRNSPIFYCAYEYAEAHPNTDVFILLASFSGTSFNAGNWRVGDGLYEQMVSETDHCLKELSRTYGRVEMAGVFGQQGESDADDQTEADAYAGLLTAMVEDYRTQIGINFPFIIGTMEPDSITTTPEMTVDAAHRNIGNVLANAAFSDNSDLTGQDSNLHFTAAHLRTVGRRYYTKWQTMTRAAPVTRSALIEITAGASALETTPAGLTVSGTPTIAGTTFVMPRGAHVRLGKHALPMLRFTEIAVIRFLNPNPGANRTPNDPIFGPYTVTNFSGTQWLAQTSASRDYQAPDFDSATNVIDTNAPTTFGQWKVVALTWDGTDLKVWEDGVAVFTDTPTFSSVTGSLARILDFGQSFNSGTRLEAECKIARIVDEVLTSDEMLALKSEWIAETVDLTSGLRADWQFADLTDSSGNGFTLTAVGTAPSLSGGVATFGGSGHYSSALTQSASWTRHIRFKTTSAVGAQHLCAGASGYGVYLDAGVIKAGGPTVIGAGSLADDQWHDAVCAYDATRKVVELWMDGAYVQGVSNHSTFSDGAAILVGAQTAANRFIGDMDRCRVWNRALNPSEIISITTP